MPPPDWKAAAAETIKMVEAEIEKLTVVRDGLRKMLGESAEAVPDAPIPEPVVLTKNVHPATERNGTPETPPGKPAPPADGSHPAGGKLSAEERTALALLDGPRTNGALRDATGLSIAAVGIALRENKRLWFRKTGEGLKAPWELTGAGRESANKLRARQKASASTAD